MAALPNGRHRILVLCDPDDRTFFADVLAGRITVEGADVLIEAVECGPDGQECVDVNVACRWPDGRLAVSVEAVKPVGRTDMQQEARQLQRELRGCRHPLRARELRRRLSELSRAGFTGRE